MLVVFALGASSAHASDDDIIAVQYSDLPKLWRQVAGKTEAPPMVTRDYRAGCARFSFIVEQNGGVSTFKVLGTFPEPEYGDMARKLVEHWRFEPTALNRQAVPAYTEHTLVWVSTGLEQPLGTHLREPFDRDGLAAQCMVAAHAVSDK